MRVTRRNNISKSPIKQVVTGGVGDDTQEPTVEESTGSTGKVVADFFTPDNKYMAMLDVLTGGVGGKGFSKYLTKTKMGKKLVKKIPGLSKLLEKTSSPKNQPIDFGKTRSFKGGVDAGDANWKSDIHMGSGPKTVEFQLNEMKSIGKNLDDMNFDATKLTPKDVKFRGIVSGRSVVEVKLPDGQTQLFYKSTDYSGKGVEDMWQAYGGHADVAGTKGWFIKDEGFKNFYDSKSFRDISGNLDRLAVEGDFQKHITKGQGYASKRK